MTNFVKSTVGILNAKGLSILGRKPDRKSTPLQTPADHAIDEQKPTQFSAQNRSLRRLIQGKSLTFIIIALLFVGLLTALYVSGKRPTEIVQKLAQQSVPLNKSIEFPVRDQKGNVTDSSLKMNLTTADKTNQILIKGKPATARSGKTFLIINLELDNPTQSKLGLAPVELIRLVDATDKKFAPDIHNDKVSIEPLSTKRTRVGFVVDETLNNFKLQIGEVSGKKDTISIIF